MTENTILPLCFVDYLQIKFNYYQRFADGYLGILNDTEIWL